MKLIPPSGLRSTHLSRQVSFRKRRLDMPRPKRRSDEAATRRTPSKRTRTQPPSDSEDTLKPKPKAKAEKKSVDYSKPNLTGPVLLDLPVTVQSPLSFDLQAAKDHLIKADARFALLMQQIPCKPFEDDITAEEVELGQREPTGSVNCFRSLCTSVLGQQVSWLAARAITHRFIRLFYPDISEKYDSARPVTVFPTPTQIIAKPFDELKSAGLSTRKTEYILDLASRFADGRLSAERLINMTDEELKEALLAVRGIGDWTVDMFSIFTMRRPNILGPGDLGLQKGLIRWFTNDVPTLIPSRIVKPVKVEAAATLLTPPGSPLAHETQQRQQQTPDNKNAVLPAPLLTPASVPKSRKDRIKEADGQYPPTPPFPASETLTREKLSARLSKKIKGNIYLSPKEMEELTASWVPYRSVGMYYMWSLQDGPDGAI